METINLLNHKDFKAKTNENGQITDVIFSSGMGNLIYSKLKEGGENKKLVYTQDLRVIGKTYQLIKYAKSYGYNVVVATDFVANSLQKEYNYENIYRQDDIKLRTMKKLVIDEGVTLYGNSIDMIQEKNIITGFTNMVTISVEEISLREKAIQALKIDIDSLLNKLKVSLDNNNFSNYKMLINNLKDTIELMNTLEHPEKTNVQNYTMNIPNLEEIAMYTSKKITDNLRISGMGI